MGLVSGFLSVYGVKIFIWLTYWSFFTLTARFIVTAVNAWRYIVFTRRSPDMPVLYKIQWLLQNMSNCSAVIVAGLYWIVLYSGQPDTFISINSHALNSVLVIVDVMVSRAPVRVQHLVYTFLFMLVFTIFTVVYWAAGGTNHKGQHYIYSTLDYTHKPWLAVAMIAGVLLIAVPLVQIIVYGFFRLRICIEGLSSSFAARTTQKSCNGENRCGPGHTVGGLDLRCSNAMHNKDREAGARRWLLLRRHTWRQG
ncbi:hypothetical protein C0Q70_20377 [Pomacea canaliculata]|uniref:Uncharacterized protein n=1 Tax=Pomacea canaliculata TaxID=400727 RepID=A0A2T7NFD9_POMCA|nr:hypothetical protein C0Q70_20377 [Pomacea canaliculata]